MRVVVDGALHGTEHFRRVLPFVEQQGERSDTDRRIRVVADEAGVLGPIQTQDSFGLPDSRGRLADRPRTGHQHRRP